MVTAINSIVDCVHSSLETPAISHSNKLKNCWNIYCCLLSMTVHKRLDYHSLLVPLWCLRKDIFSLVTFITQEKKY